MLLVTTSFVAVAQFGVFTDVVAAVVDATHSDAVVVVSDFAGVAVTFLLTIFCQCGRCCCCRCGCYHSPRRRSRALHTVVDKIVFASYVVVDVVVELPLR